MASSTSSNGQYSDNSSHKRLGDFTLAQRAIIEVLFTPREMPYRELNQKVLQTSHAPSQTQFDNAINELIRLGYLMSFIEDGEVYYLLDADVKPEKRDEVAHRSSRPDLFLDNLSD
jgi:hypothetical protein